MGNNLEELFLNHGWEHLWFEPKNTLINEYVKGPFVKPKVLFSVPYVTLCQQDGDSVRLRKGIPDCWAEYLVQNLVFPRKYLRNYELMYKDVEVVPQLRKNYRLYIGQGIPDPSFQYNESPIIARKISKDNRKNLSNNKKDNCYCCEKKYLFECPDAATVNSCPCRDCHSKNEVSNNDCGDNCKCISALQDWVMRNTELKRKKKQRRKRCSGSDISSGSSRTEDECQDVKAEFCECLRRYKPRSATTTSEEDSYEKPFNGNKMFCKSKTKVCSCPPIKSVYVKKNLSTEGNFQVKTTSKQIQTDNQPPRDSKTVQTDNAKSKLQLKCQCSSKCTHCGLYHCKVSYPKLACTPGPNFCFPANVIHNPAFICPYLSNHFIVHKPSKNDEMKKNRKEQKIKVYEIGSSTELGIKQSESKADEENVFRKSVNQDPPLDVKNDYNSKNIYYSQSSTKGFEHYKNFIDKKYWAQREELPPGISNHSSSKFVNFCKADPSTSFIKPEKFKLDKFKDFTYCRPKYSDSYGDSRMIYLGSSRHYLPRKLLHSCDQATMTISDGVEEQKNENLAKPKYIKESSENEYQTQMGNKNESYRANRRRRKLLTNRKRRRKLAASGRSSILECQTLQKLLRCPEFANKQVQVEGSDQDEISRRENDRLHSRNFPESTSLKNKNFEFNPAITETMKKFEETPKNWGETSKIRISDAYKQSLWSDSRFNKTLEKISSSSKGTWTSTALKNIVDDILLEKR